MQPQNNQQQQLNYDLYQQLLDILKKEDNQSLLKDNIAKRIFGTEQNKHILAELLECLLPDLYVYNRKNIQFLDTVIPPEQQYGKKIIYDILVLYDNNYVVNIEFQNKDEGDYDDRSLFYLAKMISKQLIEGQQYKNIKQVIQINILNYGSNNGKICSRHTLGRFYFSDQFCQQTHQNDQTKGIQYKKEYQPSSKIQAHYYLLGNYKKDDPSIKELSEKEKRITKIMIFLKNYDIDENEEDIILINLFNKILNELYYINQQKLFPSQQNQQQFKEYFNDESYNEGYQKGRQSGIEEGEQKGQIIGIFEGMLLLNQKEITQQKIQQIKNALQNDQNAINSICRELNINRQQFERIVEQIKNRKK